MFVYSDIKRCMSNRHVVFIGDSRMRQNYFAYARDTAKNPQTVAEGKQVHQSQGNLRGESVAAAILVSHMEQSYCISGFFLYLSQPSKHELPFPHGLNHVRILVITRWIRRYWLSAQIAPNDCAKSEGTITRLHRWLAIWRPLHSVYGWKRGLIPLKFPWSVSISAQRNICIIFIFNLNS